MTLKIALLDRGTWSVSGVSDEGAWDANQNDPERDRRKSDAVSRGFSVNENIDKPADSTSDMSEPGLIPHAYKVAYPSELIRQYLREGAGPGTKVEEVLEGTEMDSPRDHAAALTEHAQRLREQAAALRKQAAFGVSSAIPSLPKAPSAPRLPKMSAPKALDPRTDKPAGMNLMHGVTTVSNGSDVGSSYTSFSRRLQGSPV